MPSAQTSTLKPAGTLSLSSGSSLAGAAGEDAARTDAASILPGRPSGPAATTAAPRAALLQRPAARAPALIFEPVPPMVRRAPTSVRVRPWTVRAAARVQSKKRLHSLLPGIPRPRTSRAWAYRMQTSASCMTCLLRQGTDRLTNRRAHTIRCGSSAWNTIVKGHFSTRGAGSTVIPIRPAPSLSFRVCRSARDAAAITTAARRGSRSRQR